MKHSILVFVLLCFCYNIKAQEKTEQEKEANEITEEEVNNGSNEIKLNALMIILGAFEASYEHLLDEESSFGVNILIGYDNYILNDIQYYVSPYYRLYFGKKYAAGFYFEGFGMLNSIETEISLFNNNEERNYVTDFALGIGFGGKWVTNKGIVFELNYGVGRNLFKNDETDFDFVGKAGFSVGYRF